MSVELGTLLLCKLLKICPDVQILIILNYPFISFFISHLNAVYSGALILIEYGQPLFIWLSRD